MPCGETGVLVPVFPSHPLRKEWVPVFLGGGGGGGHKSNLEIWAGVLWGPGRNWPRCQSDSSSVSCYPCPIIGTILSRTPRLPRWEQDPEFAVARNRLGPPTRQRPCGWWLAALPGTELCSLPRPE